MAFTKVTGAGILTTSNYEVGVITATKFVGPMDGFSGNVSAGFGTFANDLRVDGNFIVNGDYTTLNTTLREVEILRVDANDNTAAAGIITQRGTGDIFNLFDTDTEVFTVLDGGKVGIGTDLSTTPSSTLTVAPHNSASGRNISIYTNNAVGNKAGLFFNQSSGTGNLAEIQAEYKGTNEGELVLSTSMQRRITIQKGGNVGIGSDIPATKLDVAGHLKLATVQGTNTSANLPVLYQHNDNVIHGGSTLNWNPAEDTLKVNGNLLSATSLYGAGGTLKLAASNHSSTSYVLITDKVEIGGNVGLGTATPQQKLDVRGNTIFGIDQVSGNPGTLVGITTIRGHHVNSDADYAQLYLSNSKSAGGGTPSTASIRAGRETNNYGTNLSFWTNGTGSAGDGSEALHINSVGVSTFKGDITLEAAGANRISMRHTSGGNAVIKNPTAANLSFGTNDQDNELTIKNGGNIGIGTENPNATLDIVSNVAAGYIASFRQRHASNYATILVDSPANNNTRPSFIDLACAGSLHWSFGQAYASHVNNTFHFSTSDLGAGESGSKLAITKAGNVGINTIDPGAKLHIKGDGGTDGLGVLTTDASGNNIFWTKDGGRAGLHYYPFVINQDNTDTDTPHGTYFYVHHASAPFIIKSDGKVGVGYTDPYYPLDVRFSSSTTALSGGSSGDWGGLGLRLENDNTTVGSMSLIHFRSGNNADWHIGTKFVGTGDSDIVFLQEGVNEKLRIKNEGKIGIGTDDPYYDVDIRNGGVARVAVDVTTGSDAAIWMDGINADFAGSDYWGLKAQSSGEFAILKASSEKFRIGSDGKAVFSEEIETPQDYPDIRPALDFNFAAVKKLDPRFTYTRTGPGSYVDHLGFVKLVGADAPRFDHDPITGECKGLLIEDSRTNQMIYSSDITDNGSQNTSYGVQNGTVTGDQTIAPDGTTTADKYAANSTNGIHRVDLFFTSGQISNSTAYTFSVFVKANGYDKLHIRYGGYNADNHGLGYDLSDGTTFAGRFDGTGLLDTVTSSSMIEYPNGWYRCSFTFTTAGDATSSAAGIFHYISNSEATTSFAGDGSSGMYFWGAQMEVGSFPTSFIPTNGATATRYGDYVSITGDEHTDFWNTSEGTYLIEYKPLELAVGNGVIIGSKRGNDGSGYPWPLYRHDTANTNIFKSYDLNGIVSINNAWVDQREVWALGFNGTNGSIVRNGTQLITNNSNMRGLIDANELWLGSSSTGSLYSMHVKRFMYYAKRITDAQLITLTS